MQMTNIREMAKNTTSSKASMLGATDPHGLSVIAMTLQSTKKTNVVLQSAPESCTIIR